MLKSKEKHKDESFYHRQSWNMAHDQGGGGGTAIRESNKPTHYYFRSTRPPVSTTAW